MIAALAVAATAFDRADWLALAVKAFDFISTALATGDRLAHAWRAGTARHVAILDDYANMSRAALLLYEATGAARYVDTARQWAAVVERHYRDKEGGYFFTADDAEALLVRTKQAYDQPNPSGNGTMAEVLARLFHLTGEDRYRRDCEAVLSAFAGEAQRNLFGLATLLNAAETLVKSLQIVVIGSDGPDLRAMLRVVNETALPTKIVSRLAPGARLPDSHPAAGKDAIAGRATAYVCEGTVCSLPVTDPAALAALLAGR